MYKPFHIALVATLLLASISSAFAAIDDTQVIDQEKSTSESELSFQTFSSCQDMNTVLKKYFRNALLEQVKLNGQGNPSMDNAKWWGMAEGIGGGGGDGMAFSSTNVQIEGIDEAEVIKTDGKYIYYASGTPEKDGFQYVTITKASSAQNLEIVKKIKLPSNYGNIQLYLADNKLTILANKWNQNYIYNPSPISIGNGGMTVVVVYDVTDVTAPKLDRFYTVDGDYSQSRREGEYLYVVSQNFINLNIWNTVWVYTTANINTYIDTDFSVEKAFPKSVEINRTSDTTKQLTLKWKKIPYSLTKDTVGCDEIEYILPKKPQGLSFLTLSTIPLKSAAPAQKKVISGDASQFFMTKGSLYIVSNYWKQGVGGSPCPINARCLVPEFRSEQNSLIHRFSTNKSTVKYEYSVLTPGMPLSQYAMNEKDGVLFTANQKDWTTNGVDIFAIDATGKLLSKLENVGANERFQAARYIGDRLYLVTFQQVDPFFVIDTKDAKAMSILWELKMPGYSTYLHPYDATHLIGIGYDTKTAQWGGTINGGLKFDLYDVADIKNPKQQYSKIIGGMGSSSDALWNPRALVWDSAKKTLLIPAQLMDQNQVTYQSSYAWQGLLAVKIGLDGISEAGRVTHIDMTGIAEKRKQECAQYTAVVTEEKCYTLISTGERICMKPGDNPANQNIPAYCFAENDDSSYLANQIWNYYPYFIQRGLSIGDTLYTASPSYIQANQYGGSYGFLKKVENGAIADTVPKG